MPFHFSAGIIIDARRGNYAPTQPYIDEKSKAAREYIWCTALALGHLKRLPTGRQLIHAINASGHMVTIFQPQGQSDLEAPHGNAAYATDPSAQDPNQFYHPLTQPPGRLKAFLQQARKQYSFKLKNIAAKVGWSEKQLRALEDDTKGKLEFPKELELRLMMEFEDLLQPGPGVDCYVRFDPSDKHFKWCQKNEIHLGAWAERPSTIALGHELIHAWRMVTGRCIIPRSNAVKSNVQVSVGLEDELMTVGMGIFANRKFTENHLRGEWNQIIVDRLRDITKEDLKNLVPRDTYGDVELVTTFVNAQGLRV